MKKQAVIFDMDGVLVDSYIAHRESWQRMAAEQGRTFTDAQFNATFGRTSREIIAELWADACPTDQEIAAMDDRKERLFREILESHFPAMPGAAALISALVNAGFALAIGSSAPPENIDLVLDQLGVRQLLGAVITASDVTRGKPDPEVFLTAAGQLGVAPSQCVVVEDAPAGIAAAHAGGMACVALISTGRTRQMLAAAELTVDSLEALSPTVFRDLLARP